MNSKKPSISENKTEVKTQSAFSSFKKIPRFLREYINIREGTDYVTYIKELRGSIYLRGSNFWFLLCSTLLACIGLDLNSTAVIIGAMLISPLMYPILGIGIGGGINDEKGALISIREFALTVLVGLITSTVYFWLTPLGLPTAEILARVKPTFLDVGVAVFGGVAGIIANTRKKVSSAIPGVAIATALIPPLCVAGFGIAKGMWEIFAGAFYLLLINSVFISASAYAVVKILKFPLKEHVDPEKEKKRRIIYYAILVVVIIPSLFIFYNIIIEAKTKNQITSFVNQNLNKGNNQVLNWRTNIQGDTLKELRIYIVGDKISKTKEDSLQNLLVGYGLEGFKLDIRDMGTSTDLKNDITQEITKNLIENMNEENIIDERDVEIEELKNTIQNYIQDSTRVNKILGDVKTFNPEINKIAYSVFSQREEVTPDSAAYVEVPTLIIEWNRKMGNAQRKAEESKIYDFLMKELELDTLQILNYR